jgi:hypothetical protein
VIGGAILLTIAIIAQFSGNRFIKVVQNSLEMSNLTSADTRSSSPEGDGNRISRMSSPVKTNNPAETKMWVKVYLIYMMILLLIGIGVFLLINYNLPISYLQPKDPAQVYEFNVLIFLMEVLSTIMSLAEISAGSIWSPGADTESTNAVNMKNSKQVPTSEGSKAEAT